MSLQLPLPLHGVESFWTPPDVLPEIEDVLALDLETCDPGIKARGPGGVRREGYVTGVAVAGRGWQIYLPFRHAGGDNLPKNFVADYVKEIVLKCPLLIFANAAYDLEWLQVEFGLTRRRGIHDVLLFEALLDEEAPGYSLNAVGARRLGVRKDERKLEEAARHYGVDPKAEMWKLPARFVGAYAEQDARLTYDLWVNQSKELEAADLEQVCHLERNLIPVIHQMRMNGVPVDVSAAQTLSKEMFHVEQSVRKDALTRWGCKIEEWSAAQIATVCAREHIEHPMTEEGNPSFTADWLEGQSHPYLQAIVTLRDLNRHRQTFVDDFIVKQAINGHIHPRWHQIASDDGGTKTGRMSCSNPNAQQIPRRSNWGDRIRACFVPEEGKLWLKLDYKQQEPRILAHYGLLDGLEGAARLANAYETDPAADVYKIMSEAAGVSRDQSKTLTLGSMYGMGMEKLAAQLGVSVDEAWNIRHAFDEALPFVRKLADNVCKAAEGRGWIKTLGGRRRHFNLWVPVDNRKKEAALPLAQAQQAYGLGIKRAFGHKALNSLIQGSAADMTKIAMLKIYEEEGLVPYLAVHDELNYGVKDEAQAHRVKFLMETACPLQVPVYADGYLGQFWGDKGTIL